MAREMSIESGEYDGATVILCETINEAVNARHDSIHCDNGRVYVALLNNMSGAYDWFYKPTMDAPEGVFV